jgi:1-deoxy-D-xylulose-5-phosphate reductoisomerase
MGAKVTIDSASLMNKGLEVIEAHWLFGVPFDRIRVVMHPTSVVHSLVQFVDGSFKAQLGLTDMRLAIQYALSHPERWTHPEMRVDLLKLGDLHFAEPEWRRYPCLALALQAGREGGTYPAVLCGADEVAVDLFTAGAIRFTDIPALLDHALSEHRGVADPDLDQILAADAWARDVCLRMAQRLAV